MSSKKFLRNVGFGLIITMFLIGIVSGVSAQPYKTISITGKVSGPWGTVNLHISARGDQKLIKGKGVGFHIEMLAEITFTITGEINENSITLQGYVIQTPLNFNFLIGLPLWVYADASTGYIYQNFAMVMEFEGIGIVVINN